MWSQYWRVCLLRLFSARLEKEQRRLQNLSVTHNLFPLEMWGGWPWLPLPPPRMQKISLAMFSCSTFHPIIMWTHLTRKETADRNIRKAIITRLGSPTCNRWGPRERNPSTLIHSMLFLQPEVLLHAANVNRLSDWSEPFFAYSSTSISPAKYHFKDCFTHHHPLSSAGTMGQMVADLPSGYRMILGFNPSTQL
jgi:hypothetical protein